MLNAGTVVLLRARVTSPTCLATSPTIPSSPRASWTSRRTSATPVHPHGSGKHTVRRQIVLPLTTILQLYLTPVVCLCRCALVLLCTIAFSQTQSRDRLCAGRLRAVRNGGGSVERTGRERLSVSNSRHLCFTATTMHSITLSS